jgi:hypothetical protein
MPRCCCCCPKEKLDMVTEDKLDEIRSLLRQRRWLTANPGGARDWIGAHTTFREKDLTAINDAVRKAGENRLKDITAELKGLGFTEGEDE